MERSFLEGLNLEKDVIDQIMAENGKDINREKSKADAIKTQLDEARQTLKGFEGVNVSELAVSFKNHSFTGKFEGVKDERFQLDTIGQFRFDGCTILIDTFDFFISAVPLQLQPAAIGKAFNKLPADYMNGRTSGNKFQRAIGIDRYRKSFRQIAILNNMQFIICHAEITDFFMSIGLGKRNSTHFACFENMQSDKTLIHYRNQRIIDLKIA